MTVLDANNSLFDWFKERSSFEIGRDLKKIVPIIDDEAETIISFRLALEELEKNGLIAHQDYNDKKFYVLTKPFDSYTQNPDIPSWTAAAIAQEINDFCDILNDQTDRCSMSNITPKDLQNLIHISQYYKTKVIEKENLIETLSLDFTGDDEEGDKKNKKKK